MTIKAKRVNKENFEKYGFYYNMKEDRENVIYSKADSYKDYMTKKPLIDTLGHLGFTIGSKAPYTISSMEKHDHTQEAIFCLKAPIILCVATSSENTEPKSEDIEAFILKEEDVIVLERNTWHDACHGLSKKTEYCYLATAGKHPAKWFHLCGEEVLVTY